MVRMDERRLLAEYVSGFAAGHLKTNEFIDRLDDFAGCEDKAVDLIAGDFFINYDDSRDETLRASKREWDRIQRTLLFLSSDLPMPGAAISWKFDIVQIPALMAALAAAWVFVTGDMPYAIGWPWWFVLPLAVARLRPWNWKQKPKGPKPIDKDALYPFPDVQTMVRLLRERSGWRKQKQPAAMRDWERNLRPSLLDKAIRGFILFGMAAILLLIGANVLGLATLYGWPVTLFLLCFPSPVSKSGETGMM